MWHIIGCLYCERIALTLLIRILYQLSRVMTVMFMVPCSSVLGRGSMMSLIPVLLNQHSRSQKVI